MADVVPQPPPAANRGLWILVVGLGVAILVVVAAMIAMAIKRASNEPPALAQPSLTPGEAPQLNLDLAPGAAVAEARMDGTYLVIHLTGPAGDEVLVIESAKSKVVSRVRFNRKAP